MKKGLNIKLRCIRERVTLLLPVEALPYLGPSGRRGLELLKVPLCCGCGQVSLFQPENSRMDRIQIEEVWNSVRTLI